LPDIVLGFSIPLQLRMAGQPMEVHPGLVIDESSLRVTAFLHVF